MSPTRRPAEPVNVRDLPAGQWRQLVINEFFEVQAAHWQAGQGGNVNLPNPHGADRQRRGRRGHA